MLVAAMTAEEFAAYLAENAFDDDSLADALGVHRQSVVKWRLGKHAITRVHKLALERVAQDRRALGERRRALARAEKARGQQRPSRVHAVAV